jgi:hypothetical protein
MSKITINHIGKFLQPFLIVIMAVILIYLSYQNMQLKKQLSSMNAFLYSSQELSNVEVGDQAFPIDVDFPGGQSLSILPDTLSSPLILAWFSYQCEPCQDALVIWNQLADLFPGQILGLPMRNSDTGEMVFAPNDVVFPVTNPISGKIKKDYGIFASPQTVIILKDGTIGYIHQGSLQQSDLVHLINVIEQSLEGGES